MNLCHFHTTKQYSRARHVYAKAVESYVTVHIYLVSLPVGDLYIPAPLNSDVSSQLALANKM